MTWYVYAIGGADVGLVKIGKTSDLVGRLAAIQRMSPVLLSLLWHTEAEAGLEGKLHEFFKAQRRHGEWFDFAGRDPVAEIREAMHFLEIDERQVAIAARRPRDTRDVRSAAHREADQAPRPRARDANIAAVREALGWAATRLALECGLENVRVEDIASVARVSHRSFNNYFASRAEAIVAVVTPWAKRVRPALLGRPVDEPIAVAVVETLVEVCGQGGEPDRTSAARLRLVVLHDEIRGEFLKEVEDMGIELGAAIAERIGGFAEQSRYPRILGAIAASSARMATENWLRPETTTPYSDLLRKDVSIAAALPVPEYILSQNTNP